MNNGAYCAERVDGAAVHARSRCALAVRPAEAIVDGSAAEPPPHTNSAAQPCRATVPALRLRRTFERELGGRFNERRKDWAAAIHGSTQAALSSEQSSTHGTHSMMNPSLGIEATVRLSDALRAAAAALDVEALRRVLSRARDDPAFAGADVRCALARTWRLRPPVATTVRSGRYGILTSARFSRRITARV